MSYLCSIAYQFHLPIFSPRKYPIFIFETSSTKHLKTRTEELPCIVMVHGFAAVKEMALDNMADIFTSKLKMTALVYDNRGYGASDVGVGQHKLDINPWEQIADFSDAVTYAQTLPQVDGTNIGAFGSSFSGGHVICVAAGDKRVKAVISQVPFIDGWAVLQRLIRADFLGGLLAGRRSCNTFLRNLY